MVYNDKLGYSGAIWVNPNLQQAFPASQITFTRVASVYIIFTFAHVYASYVISPILVDLRYGSSYYRKDYYPFVRDFVCSPNGINISSCNNPSAGSTEDNSYIIPYIVVRLL